MPDGDLLSRSSTETALASSTGTTRSATQNPRGEGPTGRLPGLVAAEKQQLPRHGVTTIRAADSGPAAKLPLDVTASARGYVSLKCCSIMSNSIQNLAEGGEKPAACRFVGVQPTGERMADAPTTPQKLLAELVGTAFLVFVGARLGRRHRSHRGRRQGPFTLAELGMISFAFMSPWSRGLRARPHLRRPHQPRRHLSLAVTGKLPWREVPGYMLAQVVGAIIGAIGNFVTLGKAAVAAGGGVPATARPDGLRPGVAHRGHRHRGPGVRHLRRHRSPGRTRLAPMAIGAIVFAVIIIVGPATGAAINPARYLGAKLMRRVRRARCLVAGSGLHDRRTRRRRTRRPAYVGDVQGPRRCRADQPRAVRTQRRRRQVREAAS